MQVAKFPVSTDFVGGLIRMGWYEESLRRKVCHLKYIMIGLVYCIGQCKEIHKQIIGRGSFHWLKCTCTQKYFLICERDTVYKSIAPTFSLKYSSSNAKMHFKV